MEQVQTAGAAVFFEDKQGQVYLLLTTPYGDQYGLPKGHQEEGQSLLSTAKREVWEETEIGFVCLFPPNPNKADLVTQYSATDKENNPVEKVVNIYVGIYSTGVILADMGTTGDWENLDTRFVPIGQIQRNEIHVYDSHKQVIEDAIRLYLGYRDKT